MAFTIEDVESRTLLQQFHALYKKQQEDEESIQNLDGDIQQEIQDRTTADEQLAEDIADLQTQLNSLGNIFTLKGSVPTVADLPASNNNIGDVWYVVSESTGYIWIDDNGTERWEQLGITVDLSNYVTQSDLTTELAGKQDNLTAGTNISIIGDIISATQPDTTKFEMLSGVSAPSTATVGAVGQKYLDTTKNDVYVCTAKTANGDDTFSYTWLLLDGNGKQNKLTAGANITIDGNNVISASGGGGSNSKYLHHLTIDGLSIDGIAQTIILEIENENSQNIENATDLITALSKLPWINYDSQPFYPNQKITVNGNKMYQINRLVKYRSSQLYARYIVTTFTTDGTNISITQTSQLSSNFTPQIVDQVIEL